MEANPVSLMARRELASRTSDDLEVTLSTRSATPPAMDWMTQWPEPCDVGPVDRHPGMHHAAAPDSHRLPDKEDKP
jgi:hypothetical protein